MWQFSLNNTPSRRQRPNYNSLGSARDRYERQQGEEWTYGGQENVGSPDSLLFKTDDVRNEIMRERSARAQQGNSDGAHYQQTLQGPAHNQSRAPAAAGLPPANSEQQARDLSRASASTRAALAPA